MSTHQILSLSNSEWTESCYILARTVLQTDCAFENAARYPNVETEVQCRYDEHNACKKFTKLSIIARFCSNFVQTLISCCLMYHKLSRSTGQRSRSQRDITYAIIQAQISCGLVLAVNSTKQLQFSLTQSFQSNTEITIIPLQIARLHSHCYRVSSRHRWYAANVQGQRSKVTTSNVKVTA